MTSPSQVESLSDAELMKLIAYSESPAERSMAGLAWGNRQFALGMKAATNAISHVNDVMARMRA